MDNEFALYIHIPYCSQKCPYCDFNAYAVREIPESEYVQALINELEFYSNQEIWANKNLRSIYFGGGTPSLFDSKNICKIVNAARNSFKHSENIEITLEANPGDLDRDALTLIYSSGINRLSLGVQSFNNKHLKTLGRWHNSEDAKNIINFAKDIGFKNISLDLMFALPEQTLADLEHDLKIYLSLKPQHLSAYELSIEKGTPFFQRYQKIDFVQSEDRRYEFFELIRKTLCNHGFNWYEISNYALPDHESRHNQSYWQCISYLGLGAGAHSFINNIDKSEASGLRFAKFAKPDQYLKMHNTDNRAIAWQEKLSAKQMLHEYIFSGLRTSKGLEWFKVNALLDHKDVAKIEFNELIQKLAKEKLLDIDQFSIVASQKARLLCEDLANQICEALVF